MLDKSILLQSSALQCFIFWVAFHLQVCSYVVCCIGKGLVLILVCLVGVSRVG